MKKFIADYLKIIGYTATGLVFLFSSFYLLMNYYHAKELSDLLYISSGDNNYTNYIDKLEKLKTNLNTFEQKNVKNSGLKNVYSKLNACRIILSNEDTLASIKTNTYFRPVDVYNLGSKFQTDVLNICWAIHLSDLTNENSPKEFTTSGPYIKPTVDALADKVSFALAEIQNNSSYFYTTSITSATIRNYLKSDYEAIASSYNEFADMLLLLSQELNQYGGENNA